MFLVKHAKLVKIVKIVMSTHVIFVIRKKLVKRLNNAITGCALIVLKKIRVLHAINMIYAKSVVFLSRVNYLIEMNFVMNAKTAKLK